MRSPFTAYLVPPSAVAYYRALGWVEERREDWRRQVEDSRRVMMSHPGHDAPLACFGCGAPMTEVEHLKYQYCFRCRDD